MTTLDWYLISKKELYLLNLWSAYFGDMLENYRALSKKRLGPFSGNRKKNTITKIIGLKVRFNNQVYEKINTR